MNGLNSIGNAPDLTARGPDGAGAAEGGDFEAIFNDGLKNTAAVMLQLIGGDIIQSVMKDEQSVD